MFLIFNAHFSFNSASGFLLIWDPCSSLWFPSCAITHPLFIQLKQRIPDLWGVWSQAEAVQVELRHDELQQPLWGQAPWGCVTSGRGDRFLQDRASQCLHLRSRSKKLASQTLYLKKAFGKKEKPYLCGAEDDSVIVLSSTGSFLLISAEANGHRPEAIINPKEVLVFYENITVTVGGMTEYSIYYLT